jgi:hypothetical protein
MEGRGRIIAHLGDLDARATLRYVGPRAKE